MYTIKKMMLATIMIGFVLTSSGMSAVYAEESEGMKGVNNANAFFDMRNGVPKAAALYLSLIHDTYNELAKMGKNPKFVVGFIGGSVRLISKDQSGFNPEDRKYLNGIAKTVSQMSKAGIKLEVCLFAVKVFGVDPASILPEINRVGNGWISEIGYQTKGYSLVPVY
ncbi:MAG: DsrE family protein [Deltaproteobacteria bacterium]|jgi:intracellular sulfur oxidation DsrE/DsrF family protein